MFKLITKNDLTDEAKLRRVGRKIKKSVFHIRNDLISSNSVKRLISCLFLLSLLSYGLSFIVQLSYSEPDGSSKTDEIHPVEIDKQAVLSTPATVPLPAASELKKEAVQLAIKPYHFPQRSPSYKLPNGMTVTENEMHNKKRCETLNTQWKGHNYHLWTNGNSQNGQDRAIRDYFNGVKLGRYIEVGSYDGETFSNTWILDWCLNWEGLLIDPSTKNLNISGNFRPNAVHYHTAIHNEDKKDCIFFENTDTALAGLEKTVKSVGTGKKFVVNCLKLQRLLDQHGWSYVDFVSIETEGNELNVLKGIDFDKVKIQLFLIETNGKVSAIESFLMPFGYRIIKQMGADTFYSLGNETHVDVLLK